MKIIKAEKISFSWRGISAITPSGIKKEYIFIEESNNDSKHTAVLITDENKNQYLSLKQNDDIHNYTSSNTNLNLSSNKNIIPVIATQKSKIDYLLYT